MNGATVMDSIQVSADPIEMVVGGGHLVVTSDETVIQYLMLKYKLHL